VKGQSVTTNHVHPVVAPASKPLILAMVDSTVPGRMTGQGPSNKRFPRRDDKSNATGPSRLEAPGTR
jgi:hypothetical protein